MMRRCLAALTVFRFAALTAGDAINDGALQGSAAKRLAAIEFSGTVAQAWPAAWRNARS
ncbi:MAG: hypothetical protein KKF85_11900 [Gammaproteobacteria bacterium]|nr:hypothetical protein [Gammaproteobacteria bacterium]MBU3989385.1 hypothetical protein [Gammaproteobacteria bacterium]MBU4006026.1 hypothetical protein [Gammaproteobacteria bacterium]MBU4022001.1 hypothetical protein [Gammaproteobacteria bacterium]MBU4094801.1 hypothetical protein [Gammaproteobacteria bacterium]